MRISEEIIDNIRESTDIVSLISSYVNLKGSGNRHLGLCPFHQESTPSFHVSSDKQLYHCFGCGASGNAITFVMEKENYDFVEAVKYLADKSNIAIEETSDNYNEIKSIKEEIYTIHTKSARFFYKQLHSDNGEHARDYIESRKLSKNVCTKFGIGYAPKDFNILYNFLKSEGYDDDLILKSGLCSEKNGRIYDKFINRLMFPIFDVRGRVIAFGGRILDDGNPKYLNSPETLIFNKSSTLFNLNYAKNSKSRDLILVEGYIDVISLYQQGIHNVVAVLGTGFNEQHAKVIRKYCDRAFLLFDSDDAGIKATKRAIPYLIDAGVKVKVVSLSDAKDPDEYVNKYGKEKFLNVVNSSIDNNVFDIMLLKQKYNIDEPSEKFEFITEVIRILNKFDNVIEQNIYIDEISKITGIDQSLIKSELNKNKSLSPTSASKSSRSYIRNTNRSDIPKGVKLAIIDLINICTYRKDIAKKVYEYVKPEYIIDSDYKMLFYTIQQKYQNKEEVFPDKLVDIFDEIDTKNKIASIYMTNFEYEDDDTIYKATVDAIKAVVKFYVEYMSAKSTNITEIQKLKSVSRDISNLLDIR